MHGDDQNQTMPDIALHGIADRLYFRQNAPEMTPVPRPRYPQSPGEALRRLWLWSAQLQHHGRARQPKPNLLWRNETASYLYLFMEG
jgi:hypothetical protein